ncbi:hypothetical protein [Arthrobacter sp. SLBN-112]|uniref:hypothetical protein n=1 Tax=Arthrobacter sp. SLBN-112 TaxID=2768452 RepID=UPI00115028F6|nr:hypothetical protein [Arthrobacter sp. SLBN-112]
MPQGAGAAFGSRFAAEAVSAETPAGPQTLEGSSRFATLSLATPPAAAASANSSLQRDAANSAPEPQIHVRPEAMESTGGPATAGDNSSPSAATVQADAESVAAGPAQPLPGTGGAGGRQAAGAPAATPEQLEELAKRLAGPLIRRIKAEMLLDRERRGLRTDVN